MQPGNLNKNEIYRNRAAFFKDVCMRWFDEAVLTNDEVKK